MVAGEGDAVAQINHPFTIGQATSELTGAESLWNRQVCRTGTLRIRRGHVRIVGGIRREIGDEFANEVLLVGVGESVIGGHLFSDCG